MFIQLIRISMATNGAMSHSVQYFFTDDYDTVADMNQAAYARYHNIIAADLQNTDIVYNAAYLINNAGIMIDHDVFDHRPMNPEI